MSRYLPLRPLALLLGASLLLAGCGFAIKRPVDQQRVAAQGVVSELYRWGLFTVPQLKVWVAPWTDNEAPQWSEVTSQYQFTPPQNMLGEQVGRAELKLPAGRYRMLAEGCWLTAGPWGSPTVPVNCRREELSFVAVAAGLQLGSLPAAVDAGATLNLSLQADPPPGRDLPVTVSHPGLSAGSLTVPVDTGAAQNLSLQALTAGSATLVAAAPAPYAAARATVAVRPRLDSVSAPSGAPGDSLTLRGEGFVTPFRVLFGNAATAMATSLTRQQAVVQVPPTGLNPGALTLRVSSNSELSAAQLAFTVLPPPPPPALLLFRSHATGVETLRFVPAGPATPAAFSLVASANVAAESAGLNVVGLRRQGPVLLRASASALEAFTIGGTPANPSLVRSAVSASTGQNSAALSGNGADAAFLPGAWVRGTDRGLEVYTPGSGTLRWQAQQANRPGLASAGVALLAHAPGSRLLRSTGGTLELWDLSNLAAPQLSTFTNTVFAAPLGQGLDWLNPGQEGVRNFASGIQRVTVGSNALSVVSGGSNGSGGATPFQTLLVLPDGMVARTTAMNLEIYDLSFGTAPVRCATSNQGFAGSGGVALAAQGRLLFRATSVGIEAWDLSSLVCSSTPLSGTLPPPLRFNSGLQPAPTGVGLAL